MLPSAAWTGQQLGGVFAGEGPQVRNQCWESCQHSTYMQLTDIDCARPAHNPRPPKPTTPSTHTPPYCVCYSSACTTHLQSRRAAPDPVQTTPHTAVQPLAPSPPDTPPGCQPASGLTLTLWALGGRSPRSQHAAAVVVVCVGGRVCVLWGSGKGEKDRSNKSQ